MLVRIPSAYLPAAIDLRQWAGPVKDQGAEGSCTGHAFSSAREWIARRHEQKFPVLSPQDMYVQALVRQGSFPQDTGSDGTVLCETLIATGCCEEAIFPYRAGEIRMPTPEQVANALLWRAGAYHGILNSTVAISVLGDPVPWPIEVGFSVPQSFESELIAHTGIMQPLKPGEPVLGGHEVVITGGYDIGALATLRPANCPPAVLGQNSWGRGWGIGGYFWMPLAVLDAPDTDMKIVHTGHPWH